MERRSLVFGALAGVSLLLGVPAYDVHQKRELIQGKARVVMDMVLAGREEKLAPQWTTEEVVAFFRDYRARYGAMEEYQVEGVKLPFIGLPQIYGSVKRKKTWFRFSMTRGADGRGFEYSETLATYSE